MKWNHRIKLKHLLTEDESPESVRTSMKAIADKASEDPAFTLFDFSRFYNIPDGDEVVSCCDYGNRLLDRLYRFADEYRIWIE